MARRMRRGAQETDPTPISSVLKAVAEDRGWDEHLALGKLHENWAEVVGAQVAGRSTPIKLESGRLTIRVEPGAWAAELALMGHSIATAAVRFLGGDLVQEVAIVTGRPRSI